MANHDLLEAIKPDQKVILPVKQFLTFETCPEDWQNYDLYLFQDEKVVFYVGQSHGAFRRVWRHFQDGFKGRSVVGKFIRNNWPGSMRFTIALLSSIAPIFTPVQHDLDLAERWLIEQLRPCFNDTFNGEPSPLPSRYTPPTQSVKRPWHLKKMMQEAQYAVQQDRNSLRWH